MNLPVHTLTDAGSAHTDSHDLIANSVAALTQRTTQLQALLNTSLSRHSHSLGASLPVCMSLAKLEPEILNELFQLQSAIAKRFMEQNNQWLEGVQQIVSEASKLKKANTLSKFMEQQCDLVGQWVSLCSTQTTNLTTQLENIQVDVAYWLAQKASPAE